MPVETAPPLQQVVVGSSNSTIYNQVIFTYIYYILGGEDDDDDDDDDDGDIDSPCLPLAIHTRLRSNTTRYMSCDGSRAEDSATCAAPAARSSNTSPARLRGAATHCHSHEPREDTAKCSGKRKVSMTAWYREARLTRYYHILCLKVTLVKEKGCECV